eukprot:6492385-Amphidinium_carterae.1
MLLSNSLGGCGMVGGRLCEGLDAHLLWTAATVVGVLSAMPCDHNWRQAGPILPSLAERSSLLAAWGVTVPGLDGPWGPLPRMLLLRDSSRRLCQSPVCKSRKRCLTTLGRE